MSYTDRNVLMQIFSRVDRDRSGYISAQELQAALSNSSWNPFDIETVRLMICIFDRDGDRTIGFEEFVELYKYITNWTNLFNSADRDGSRNISRQELMNILRSFGNGYRLSEPFYNLLMKKFDRTNSGAIYFDGFIQLCIMLETFNHLFREMDRDRNGIVHAGYEDFLKLALILKT